MSAHTPGPWEATTSAAGGTAYTVVDGEGLPVAWVVRREQKAEARLNACLIAAAPDLLAGLKRIADTPHTNACAGFGTGICPRCVASAAVARAEGR